MRGQNTSLAWNSPTKHLFFGSYQRQENSGDFPQLCGSKHQNISTFCAGHSYHGHLWHLWRGLVPLVHCHGMDGWMDGWMSLGPRGSLKIGSILESWNRESKWSKRCWSVIVPLRWLWRKDAFLEMRRSRGTPWKLDRQVSEKPNTWPKRCHVVNVRIDLQYSNHLKTNKCPWISGKIILDLHALSLWQKSLV